MFMFYALAIFDWLIYCACHFIDLTDLLVY